jgi:membrane protein
MDQTLELTPEARARHPGKVRARLTREYAKVRPGSAAFEVVKRAALGVFNDGFIHAGNLAYLALMTLFPFIIVAAAVLSVAGQSRETQHAIAVFLHYLPKETAELLTKPIADVLTQKTGALLWVGGLLGLWTVSGFIDTIRDIFRRAYGTKSTSSFFRSRASSSLAILGSMLIVMLSFLVQGLLTAVEHFIYRLIPFAETASNWIGLSRLIPGVIMFGALYMLFYFVTPSKYRYTKSRKWPGALFTAVWWIAITAGLPWALSLLGGYDSTYGSLAGVVVMLLFFYLVGLGFVFGAHLNAALAEPEALGLHAAPTEPETEPAPAATA